MPGKTKFLVKNVSSRDGLYRASQTEDDKVLKKGSQLYLDFPPLFHSVEIKVIEVKA